MHKLILGEYKDEYFNLRSILDKMGIELDQELPTSFLERFKDHKLIYVGDRYNFIDGNVEYVHPNKRLNLKVDDVTYCIDSEVSNYLNGKSMFGFVTKRINNTKFTIGDQSFDLNIFKDKVKVDSLSDFLQRMKNILGKKIGPDTADFMISQLDLIEGVRIRYDEDIRMHDNVTYFLMNDNGSFTSMRLKNRCDTLSQHLSTGDLNNYVGFTLDSSKSSITKDTLTNVVRNVDPIDYGTPKKFNRMIDLSYEDLSIQWEFLKQSYSDKVYHEYDGKLFINKRWCKDILRKFNLWIK